MKNYLSMLILLLLFSVGMNSQETETTYTISLEEAIYRAGHGNIVRLQIAKDYPFLKNIPNVECDLSAINYFKMNQYVKNDSIPNQVYLFVGVNESKSEKYVIVDANNNYDFSDDEFYTFFIPKEPLTRPQILEKCVTMEITLNPQRNDNVAHIGMDPYNYFPYKDGMPQDERLRVVITFADYMTIETQIEDVPVEIDSDISLNLFKRGLNDKMEFIIRYYDNAGDCLGYKSINKGDTVQIQGRLLQLVKIDHPNIYIKPTGMLADSSRVGTFVPVIYAKGLDTDKDIQLNELMKNKYVFIDFWGSWCNPCIASIPKLKKLHEKIKDRKDVLMLGLAFESISDLGKLKGIIKDKEIEWQNFWINQQGAKSKSSTVKKLDIQSYPTYLIIDNTGKIVYKEKSMFKTEEAIEIFLNLIEE